MNRNQTIEKRLRELLDLYKETLNVALLEAELLGGDDGKNLDTIYQTKREMLPRLNQGLTDLKELRTVWTQLDRDERKRCPAVSELMRQCQDMIMRFVVLDRENEQNLLRRGLVNRGEVPSFNRQRPRFVADLYQSHKMS